MTTQALKIAESIEYPKSPHEENDSRPLLFRMVSNEVARRAETIQRELEATFDPSTPVQTAAVAELALARTRQYDLEAAYDALIAEARAHAADAADRCARDRFAKDRVSWLSDPALNLPILAATLKGTECLAQIWEDFATSLAPGSPGPTDDQKRLAAAALGSPWQVDKVRGEGVWLWSRLIRIAKEPGFEASHWAKQSNSPDSTPERARWIGSLAPDPATARTELAERARAEHARWSQVAEFCRQRESQATDMPSGLPVVPIVVDAGLEKRIRQTARELSAARNRADRLERRLDSLMKPRRNSRQKASGRELPDLTTPQAPIPAALNLDETSGIPEYGSGLADSCIQEEFASAKMSTPGDIHTEAAPAETSLMAPVNMAEALSQDESAGGATFDGAGDCESRSREPVEDDDSEAMARTLASLKTRLKQFRYLNWRDPKAISPEDVEILAKIRKLPRSANRDELIRQVFGSEKSLKRAWRSYLSWSANHEPAGLAMASD
jgi:hypothetical protein